MHNVDTISVVLNFRNINIDYYTINIKADKIKIVDAKIQEKLYFDKENQNKLLEGRNDIAKRGNYKGYTFYYNCEWYSLTVSIPHFKIEKYTGNEILEEVKQTVMEYFELGENEMVEINLSRLDIKNDYLCNPEEDMKIIKNILLKARNSFRFYTKKIIINSDRGFLIKYNSGKKNNYGETYEKTRQTFKVFNLVQKASVESLYNLSENIENEKLDKNNNYIEYAFYDKSEEIKIKVERGKADKTEIEKYKNIFRCEARIKNGRLNSNKFENPYMTKTLTTYYNEEMTNQLYDKYIKDILGTKNFYRIDIAVAKVRQSSFTNKKKQLLEELLVLVNKCGYTTAEEIWLKKHSKATFYNYIHSLETLGINILTFDIYIDNVKINKTEIVNFGQRCNGIKEI